MESQTLYRVKKEDLPKLEKLLVKCFAHDPLYCKLIPEKETRERLLPELFKCDLTEFIETCEIYSDSEEMNSLLVVSDDLPGSGSGHAASWSGGHPDGRSEPLCPGASSYGFTGDSQPGQCAYV